MDSILLSKTAKSDARARIAEIAKQSTGDIFFSDHCEMRMIERQITLRQVLQVLRRGEIVGDVAWNTDKERGWKMKLKCVAAGSEIVVVAKLIEREQECVIALTTFEKF